MHSDPATRPPEIGSVADATARRLRHVPHLMVYSTGADVDIRGPTAASRSDAMADSNGVAVAEGSVAADAGRGTRRRSSGASKGRTKA